MSRRKAPESREQLMRVACLYDIHANVPALEAVLADVREARAEHIIIGGDALPGPMPRECLDLLYSLDIPTQFIIGNGDRETAAAARGPVGSIIPEFFREAMKWNAGQLRPRDLQAIDSWPLTVQLSIDGIGETLFCHATPRNDTEIFVKTTADDKLQPIFDTLGVQLVVCGHTHMQFDRIVGRTRIINAGSVGMPFQMRVPTGRCSDPASSCVAPLTISRTLRPGSARLPILGGPVRGEYPRHQRAGHARAVQRRN
jgi:predicted phosphodiesterase